MDPWRNIAHLSKKEVRALQDKKLSSFINTYIYPFSPYYRNLFDQNGIDPKSIKTVGDLKRIPFTSKHDFISSKENPQKFRDFVLQPSKETIRQHWPVTKTAGLALTKMIKGEDYVQDELSRQFRPSFMTFTTGTTEKPISYFYTTLTTYD